MATPAVALRFRDSTPGVDTIQAHREVLSKFRAVWWGWWKKEFEDHDATALRSKLITDTDGSVLLVNRKATQAFLAKFATFADLSGIDLERVPAHYRDKLQGVAGFFLLTSIVETKYDPQLGERLGERTLLWTQNEDPDPHVRHHAKTPTPEIKKRIEALERELSRSMVRYTWLAKGNYRFAYALMTVALMASAVAGLGGIFLALDSRIVGAVALLPGILALVASVLKPQGRANWHYRKRDSLGILKRTLEYELSESPSADDVATVAKAWSVLDREMNKEWEDNFTLNWSLFLRPQKLD